MKNEVNENELKKKLSAEEYSVLREKGTEAPFSGKYVDHDEAGQYLCKVCQTPLFSSKNKFHSGSGWPSFDDITSEDNILLHNDDAHGMHRTEVVCKTCGSHLGHLFDDGPEETTGKRYCINSVCLDFKPEESSDKA